MPGKHVHFASHNVSYDLATASTPSPATSISSLPSSTGPITPPSYSNPLPSVHSYAPTKSSATLHPLLVVSRPRAVNFDVTQHPASISTPYASLSSRRGLLLESAVTPPVARMLIRSPHLPWHITVTPANGAFITVSDVLYATYHTLRKNVTSSEFNMLPGKREMQRVAAAYQARYRRIQDRRASDEEKKGGVKRVDFLMEAKMFAGLSKGTQDNVWVMSVQS